MPRIVLRAALMGAVLASALVAAPAAHAARLTSSAATAAAERVAERYADATNADDHGVDRCARRNRRAFDCDVYVSIELDETTRRECTATVTVRLGNRRRAKPTTTHTGWTCEEESVADDEFGDDAPVDEDEPVADDEESF